MPIVNILTTIAITFAIGSTWSIAENVGKWWANKMLAHIAYKKMAKSLAKKGEN